MTKSRRKRSRGWVVIVSIFLLFAVYRWNDTESEPVSTEQQPDNTIATKPMEKLPATDAFGSAPKAGGVPNETVDNDNQHNEPNPSNSNDTVDHVVDNDSDAPLSPKDPANADASSSAKDGKDSDANESGEKDADKTEQDDDPAQEPRDTPQPTPTESDEEVPDPVPSESDKEAIRNDDVPNEEQDEKPSDTKGDQDGESKEGEGKDKEDPPLEDEGDGPPPIENPPDKVDDSSLGYRTSGGRLPSDVIKMENWASRSPNKCITQGKPDIPEGDDSMLRTPYFILLGALKCGSQALSNYLWEHPKIAHSTGKEMHFFDKESGTFVNGLGVRRKEARELYKSRFEEALSKTTLESDMVAFDSTPRYIFDADRNPAMILCVVPWVKLLAIVRNPIDRIASHYNALNKARKQYNLTMVDWDVWIQDDIRLLQEAGVVANRTKEEMEAFTGSEEEVEAWTRYTRTPGSQYIVGRGLYAIQLRLWLAEMDRVGKPRSDLMIIQSENLRSNTQSEYSRVLNFLGLQDHTLKNSSLHYTTTPSDIAMPEDLRRKLEKFYAPYNEQLYSLLGYKWKGVWDPPTMEES